MTFEAIPDRTLVRTRGGSRRYLKLFVEAPASLDERPRQAVLRSITGERGKQQLGQALSTAGMPLQLGLVHARKPSKPAVSAQLIAPCERGSPSRAARRAKATGLS